MMGPGGFLFLSSSSPFSAARFHLLTLGMKLLPLHSGRTGAAFAFTGAAVVATTAY
jgi:hypothetical protein